jgi:addiction module RelE/StbE family toxin
MDYQVIWSPEALDDVDEIASYIAKDSPQYAQSVVEQVIIRSRKLSSLALRGRIVAELDNADYRETFVYSYRMIYKVTGPQVAIIAVIHGARLLDIDDRMEH